MQKQVTLNPGGSQRVSFSACPLNEDEYTAKLDGLAGTFSATAPAGWTAGVTVQSISVSPSTVYVGEIVDIITHALYPSPLPLPATIHGVVEVDGVEIQGIWEIDFRNPALIFKYTTTAPGNFTARAQDKSATFVVLENPVGNYYSPFGGIRMPLCIDILIPGVDPFTKGGFTHPGGDLRYSDIYICKCSEFQVLEVAPSNVKEQLPYARPAEWAPISSVITSWISYFHTKLWGIPPMFTSFITMMATSYTCQEYWDSKEELANMILGCKALGISVPDDWKIKYGKFDLSRGIRDWVFWPGISSQCTTSVAGGICRYTITCPYCGPLTTPWTDPRTFDKLAYARSFLEHVETRHPDHPLTEPAWF